MRQKISFSGNYVAASVDGAFFSQRQISRPALIFAALFDRRSRASEAPPRFLLGLLRLLLHKFSVLDSKRFQLVALFN